MLAELSSRGERHRNHRWSRDARNQYLPDSTREHAVGTLHIGVFGMAQATKGQTKCGTAGKKIERVLVHQKGGRLEDHLGLPWMDGIPS